MTTDAVSLRVRFAIAIVAALGFLGIALVHAGAADAKKPRKGPAGLKFYKPPNHLPKKHGKLIWFRKAGGVVPLKEAKFNDNVLYSSRGTDGNSIGVSGTVSVPKGKPPKGGFPVITYAHGTTGSADVCAPSRNTADGPAQPYISYTDDQLNAWLHAGYAVLRTDYEGLGDSTRPHPYVVGESEGRSVLDIVSAARQLDPKIGKNFLIAGHSQGGQSALFAAGLASSWTPKLHLHGTVAYAPASHILDEAKVLDSLTQPSSLSALALMVLGGAVSADPNIDPNAILSDKALPYYPRLETECLSQLSNPDELGGVAPADLIRPGADRTELYKVLGEMNPAVKTAAPILLAQGTADTTVFPFYTDQLNTELQNQGDTVDYKKYDGVTHGAVVGAAENDALAFFQKQLPAKR